MLQERHDLHEAIVASAEVRMRPVLMTSLAAAIGVLPAAIAVGIGSHSQLPLARVVFGGVLMSFVVNLVVLPVLHKIVHR